MEPAAGERVEVAAVMAVIAGVRADLHDGHAEVDALGAGADPGQHGRRVRAVGLGDPGHRVAQPIRFLGHVTLDWLLPAPSSRGLSEAHRGSPDQAARADRRCGSGAFRHLGRRAWLLPRLGLAHPHVGRRDIR